MGSIKGRERFYIAEVVQRNNLEIVHFHWKNLRYVPFAINKEEVIKHYERELKTRTELLNQFKKMGKSVYIIPKKEEKDRLKDFVEAFQKQDPRPAPHVFGIPCVDDDISYNAEIHDHIHIFGINYGVYDYAHTFIKFIAAKLGHKVYYYYCMGDEVEVDPKNIITNTDPDIIDRGVNLKNWNQQVLEHFVQKLEKIWEDIT